MASLKNIIILYIICATCQKTNGQSIKNDTIVFSYSKAIYNKIANDSIKELYRKQYNIYSKGGLSPDVENRAISLHYKFEDLTFFPIPKFRLYKDAYEDFNCNSSIEYYIAFEEFNKYQFSLVKFKNQILNKIEVPNPFFERERICNPGLGNTVDSYTYQNNYIATLSSYPESYTDYYKGKFNNNDNFFFEIYGLFQVLFEIDIKTGLLYSNYYGDTFDYGTNRRMLANDYIRKYIGEKKIKVLASGNYKEIDFEDLEMPKPCENININSKKVFLKVIRKE